MAMKTRREMLTAGGVLFAGLVLPPGWRIAGAAEEIVEIRMKSDPQGGHVGFDPIGLVLKPGQTVRWVCEANVHTATAYHPKNNRHSLRIPKSAQPWNSNYLLPGQRFEVRLTIEGVYDYFCTPHEHAGMVGRLVVGTPSGPGAEPFDYFAGTPEGAGWMPVPKAAQAAFPAIADILREGAVHAAA